MKTLLQKILSVKNSTDKRHKVFTILGFKVKFKRVCDTGKIQSPITSPKSSILLHEETTQECLVQNFIYKNPLTFLNWIAVKNTGDLHCSPVEYFKFANYQHIDCRCILDKVPILTDNIIIGGGIVDSEILRFQNVKKKIGWGLGLFRDERYIADLRSSNFTLLGTREYNYEGINNRDVFYCPCVSCMNPLFDKVYEQKYHTVVYIHKIKTSNEDLGMLNGLPIMTNEDDIKDIIEFLGSAEYIVTNSYHGVYWGTILGKKVLCIPYNSKFYGFKYPPVYVTFENWRDRIGEAVSYPEALEDCRMINLEFYKKVVEVLNNECAYN